jgi:hypothetical protein
MINVEANRVCRLLSCRSLRFNEFVSSRDAHDSRGSSERWIQREPNWKLQAGGFIQRCSSAIRRRPGSTQFPYSSPRTRPSRLIHIAMTGWRPWFPASGSSATANISMRTRWLYPRGVSIRNREVSTILPALERIPSSFISAVMVRRTPAISTRTTSPAEKK